MTASTRFRIEADDGETIAQLLLVTTETDEPGEFKVDLRADGLIGSRETVAYLLERIHRLYPKSEFAELVRLGKEAE